MEQLKGFLDPLRQNFEEAVYKMVRNNYFAPTANAELAEWVSMGLSKAPPTVALPSITDLLTRNYDKPIEIIWQEEDSPVVAKRGRPKT